MRWSSNRIRPLLRLRYIKKNLSFFKKGFSVSEGQRGSVLLYIFIAVGLLAALTYAFIGDSRDGMSTQNAVKTAQELYAQTNLIRSAIIECTLLYPGGGGDLDANGTINSTDNPNNPYPINPSSALNPEGAQADDSVKYISCTGAPSGKRNLFQGTNNQGRILPPPPDGFSDWVYVNDTNGVRIKITAPNTASGTATLDRLMEKFATCQADLDYGSCGARCFTAWILRAACP